MEGTGQSPPILRLLNPNYDRNLSVKTASVDPASNKIILLLETIEKDHVD
jgi:hypothetical protein